MAVPTSFNSILSIQTVSLPSFAIPVPERILPSAVSATNSMLPSTKEVEVTFPVWAEVVVIPETTLKLQVSPLSTLT